MRISTGLLVLVKMIDKIVSLIVEESLEREGSDLVSNIQSVHMDVSLGLCKVMAKERQCERNMEVERFC